MFASLTTALWPHPVLALALAVLAAAGGGALTFVAARRTVTMPLTLALEAETELLAGVLGDLRRYPYLTNIKPSDFASGAHARIWDALQQTLGPDAHMAEGASEEDCATVGAALTGRANDILAGTAALLAAGPAPAADADRFGELAVVAGARGYITTADSSAQDVADGAVMTAAADVLAGGDDRNRLSGAGLVLPTRTPDSCDPARPPLERVHVPPTRTRTQVTAALSALAASFIPGTLTAAHLAGPAALVGGLALALLLAASVVIALVDLDTFFIDMKVWVVGTVATWVAAVGAVALAGEMSRVVAGVVMVVATAVLFEGSNLLFKLARGVDGQGFGDTLIIVATVGAPAALTGSIEVGFWAVMGGLLAAIAGWVAGRVTGRVNRNTPFAFGPWLAAGWVIALVLFCTNTHLLT